MSAQTIQSVQTPTIETLRAEAATAGDLSMVEVCDRALRGDRHALAQVQRTIADAKAMQ